MKSAIPFLVIGALCFVAAVFAMLFAFPLPSILIGYALAVMNWIAVILVSGPRSPWA